MFNRLIRDMVDPIMRVSRMFNCLILNMVDPIMRVSGMFNCLILFNTADPSMRVLIYLQLWLSTDFGVSWRIIHNYVVDYYWSVYFGLL